MPPHGQGMQSPVQIADSIYQPQNDYMHPVEQSMMGPEPPNPAMRSVINLGP